MDTPVMNIIPVQVTVPEIGKADAYLLDTARLTIDERNRLIAMLAARFLLTVEDVERNLDETSCPILANEVVVRIPRGLALSMMDDEELCDGNDDVD
jgi:hypothetical protein